MENLSFNVWLQVAAGKTYCLLGHATCDQDKIDNVLAVAKDLQIAGLSENVEVAAQNDLENTMERQNLVDVSDVTSCEDKDTDSVAESKLQQKGTRQNLKKL